MSRTRLAEPKLAFRQDALDDLLDRLEAEKPSGSDHKYSLSPYAQELNQLAEWDGEPTEPAAAQAIINKAKRRFPNKKDEIQALADGQDLGFPSQSEHRVALLNYVLCVCLALDAAGIVARQRELSGLEPKPRKTIINEIQKVLETSYLVHSVRTPAGSANGDGKPQTNPVSQPANNHHLNGNAPADKILRRPIPRHTGKPAGQRLSVALPAESRNRDINPVVAAAHSQMVNTFCEQMYIEDKAILDIPAAMIVMRKLIPGQSVTMKIVGPPGSAKSEGIGSVDHRPEVYKLDNCSSHAPISGYVPPDDPDRDPSLIPQFDGKVVVISDGSVIRSMPSESRRQVDSVLRVLQDGRDIVTAFGNVVRRHKASCDLLICDTPRSEMDLPESIANGERSIRCQIKLRNIEAVTRRAIENTNRQAELREILKVAQDRLIDSVYAQMQEAIPAVSEEVENQITLLASFMGRARTHLQRKQSGAADELANPEPGTRVGMQLIRVGQGLSLIHGRHEISECELTFLRRLALDSLPSIRRAVLLSLVALRSSQHERYFADQLRISPTAVRLHLEDLYSLEIVEKPLGTNKRSLGYILAPKYRERCQQLGITPDL